MRSPRSRLRQQLALLQYNLTREDGVERPFAKSCWNNYAEGLYLDIISGVLPFSATATYESGTGWPSFSKPLTPAAVVEQDDPCFQFSPWCAACMPIPTWVMSLQMNRHRPNCATALIQLRCALSRRLNWSSWDIRNNWSCSGRADPGRFVHRLSQSDQVTGCQPGT
jgi:hypothetical protein